jgi:phospholipid/cholesterol/gamma-HCH transport system permease protein
MTQPVPPGLKREETANGPRLLFSGDWTTPFAAVLAQLCDAVQAGSNGVSGAAKTKDSVELDLSAIGLFDTAGAWHVKRLSDAAAASGVTVRMTGPLAGSGLLARVLATKAGDVEPPPARVGFVKRLLEVLGRNVAAVGADFLTAMHILGSVVRGAQLKANHKTRFSITPVVAHLERIGVGAVPIVVLMATIIGAIIAQQGAFQLRYFGAEIYVVDLVGILVFREIGVLITSIMVAGRTGSAITAEIGSMKMREEVDALTVIGLNPVSVLVFPRLVALVIALPLLVVIANLAALGGAAVVASLYSGISFDSFIDRLREATDITSVMAGLIKAPFMALIIGIIAAAEGLKVEGSAESLGRCVTRSVVKAIFVVIVVDGLFAMFYAAIDF